MRVQISIACLLAATQAIDLSKKGESNPITLLAQTSASDGCCCQAMPCMPTCQNECDDKEEDKDGHMDADFDVTNTAIPEISTIGEEIIEEAGLFERTEAIVGENEAETIIEEILEPIIDTEILQQDLHVNEIVEAVDETLTQEDLTIQDPLPEIGAVVELIENEVIAEHEDITVIETTPENLDLTEEDLRNAEVVEISNDFDDVVDVVIITNPHVPGVTREEETAGNSSGDGSGDVSGEEPEEEIPEPEVVEEVPEPEVIEEFLEPEVIEEDPEPEVVEEFPEPEVVEEVPEPEVVEEVPEPEVVDEAPEPEAEEGSGDRSGNGSGDMEEVPEAVEEIPEPEVPEPEVVEETPEPEVVEETPEPEVVEETPEPEVVEETPEPEVVEETPEPEVVEETPEPEVEEEEESYPKEVEVYETTVEPLPAGEGVFAQLLAEANGAPLILDFQYDACDPCQDIAPEFEALKDQYPDVIFRKVDIFEHRDLLMELGVSAIPTFKFWVNDEEFATVEGGDDESLLLLSDTVEDVLQTYYDEIDTTGLALAQTDAALSRKLSALF